ncbi:MAG: 50S ribosomal protein L9 [Gemmatimonadetes bacterium]|nr:50S ribosomal protein L9 [Gemmatimonadota bacterium]
MKVILKKSVAKLGDAGVVVSVKAGYGRNYLIPQGLAYLASEANVARLEAEQAVALERSRKDFLEARRRASQLEGISLVFKMRAGEDGKLFGSVTRADIADQANSRGLDFELDKRIVMLEEPIKALGVTNVSVHLHADVNVDVEVHVEPEES